jgi:hypothetical protein
MSVTLNDFEADCRRQAATAAEAAATHRRAAEAAEAEANRLRAAAAQANSRAREAAEFTAKGGRPAALAAVAAAVAAFRAEEDQDWSHEEVPLLEQYKEEPWSADPDRLYEDEGEGWRVDTDRLSWPGKCAYCLAYRTFYREDERGAGPEALDDGLLHAALSARDVFYLPWGVLESLPDEVWTRLREHPVYIHSMRVFDEGLGYP